ncbi:hypothetical protein SRHO_G00044820 [Serrasalmus rhombeus]
MALPERPRAGQEGPRGGGETPCPGAQCPSIQHVAYDAGRLPSPIASPRGPQGDGQASQQHTPAEQIQSEGHVNWREGRKWINKHTNSEEPRQQSHRLVQNAKNEIGPTQANDLQTLFSCPIKSHLFNLGPHRHSVGQSSCEDRVRSCYLSTLTPVPACLPVRSCRCVNHPALLTEGARYFNVLITLHWTLSSFSPFPSHAALSLGLSPLPSPPPKLLITVPRNRPPGSMRIFVATYFVATLKEY